MKIGETIEHNGIKAVLVEGEFCKMKCPFYFNYCNDMIKHCMGETSPDDDKGIFKQVKTEE